MKRLLGVGLVLVVAIVSASAAFATEYVFLSGATDFSLGSSYEGSPATLPGANDEILLPANTTIAISAPSASFDTFANCRRVKPQEGSVVEITVAEGFAEMKAAFSSYGETGASYRHGELVKLGGGELRLMADGTVFDAKSTTYYYDYWIALTISAGTLFMPQYSTASHVYYGWVTVEKGATLYITAAKVNTGSWTQVQKLDGEGTVTLAKTSPDSTRSGHSISVIGTTDEEYTCFKGTLLTGSNFGLTSYCNGANYTLMGENSTCSLMIAGGNGKYPEGATGVVKLSSLVRGECCNSITYQDDNGAIVYVGDEDQTANMPISFNGNRSNPQIVDFGLHGGLDITGNWTMNPANFVRNVRLYGDSAHECVFANSMTEKEATSAFAFTKRGTGALRFGNVNVQKRAFGGGLFIENGTVRFDSIEEAGSACSLGLANKLTAADATTLDSPVPYAYSLGAEGCDPVFEYTGSIDAFCSTRPVALVAGGGRLRNSTAYALDFSGVSARDAGSTPTLVLDGSGTSDGNVVREISDGASGAKVNVTKEGTGSWSIGGNLTFSGKLKVSGGALALAKQNRTPKPTQYKWYRLSIARLYGDNKNSISIREICLFDKDGVRQNANLTVRTPSGEPYPANPPAMPVYIPETVAPGEAAYDVSMAGRWIKISGTQGEQGLAETFGNNFATAPAADPVTGLKNTHTFGISLQSDATTALVPTEKDPSTWISIVMHLRDDANPVTHFDIQGFGNSSSRATWPSRLMLEASIDGESWDVVFNNATEGAAIDYATDGYNGEGIGGPTWGPTDNNVWLSDGHACTANSGEEKTYYWKRPLADERWTASATEGVSDTFTWYRLSIAQIGPDGGNSRLYLREICLFDKDGVRQNANLTVDNGPSGATNGIHDVYIPETLQPGQAAFDARTAGHRIEYLTSNGETGIGECFANTFSTVSPNTHTLQCRWRDGANALVSPVPGDRLTWIPIVMRLPRGAHRVTHFDIQLFSNGGSKSYWPSRLMLEASCNGKDWTVVFNNATTGEAFDLSKCGENSGYGVQEANKWLSDGKAAMDASEPNNYKKRIYGEGCTLTRTSQPFDDATYSQLANISGVQVEGGATFSTPEPITFSSLVVDVSKTSGTFRGFDFAEVGFIDILGTVDWTNPKLPIAFADCTGVENIANWTVSANGKRKGGYRIAVKNGELSVERAGLMMIVQ